MGPYLTLQLADFGVSKSICMDGDSQSFKIIPYQEVKKEDHRKSVATMVKKRQKILCEVVKMVHTVLVEC